MPLEAHLYLDTSVGPDEIKTHLLRTMPFYDEPDFETIRRLSNNTASIGIRRRLPNLNRFRDYPDPFCINYKIVTQFLCIDKLDPGRREEYYIQAFQAIVSLLKHFSGDAVLIMYHDVPMLARKDGALRLMHTKGGIWDACSPANRLSLVDLPYTVEPLSNHRW